jgi:hypothetical protein
LNIEKFIRILGKSKNVLLQDLHNIIPLRKAVLPHMYELVARIIRINIMKKSVIVLILIIFFIGCESSMLDPYKSTPPNINYNLPTDSYVKLTFENSYNTIIYVLVDEEQAAGVYQIDVPTDELTEGIYFYTLTARGVNDKSYFEATKRMILITK